MWNMLWPVALIVLSNTIYNISQKSTPANANTFGALTVTYLVAAFVSAIAFVGTAGIGSIGMELRKLNWTSLLLGLAIIGLEAGYIFLYRAGWKVSAGSVVCNIVLAIVLVAVGALFYGDKITLRQIAGIILCMGGLALITI